MMTAIRIALLPTLLAIAACGGVIDDDTREIASRHLNSACSFDWQCASDENLVCRPAAVFKDHNRVVVQKRCLNPAKKGEDCGAEDDCEAGLRCRPLKNTMTSDFPPLGLSGPVYDKYNFTGVCAEVGNATEACDEDNDCADNMKCSDGQWKISVGDFEYRIQEGYCYYRQCQGEIFCDKGQVCRWDALGDNTLTANIQRRFNRCQDPGVTGTYCHEDEDCADGLVCLGLGNGPSKSGKCGAP